MRHLPNHLMSPGRVIQLSELSPSSGLAPPLAKGAVDDTLSLVRELHTRVTRLNAVGTAAIMLR
jgi:hypothetical protein